MKREEAISLLGWFKSKTNREDDLEAIDMAIEALSEPSGDLISRADALRELNGACSNWKDDAKVQEIVMAIPSAKPIGDLISRADAIEAVTAIFTTDGCIYKSLSDINTHGYIVEALKALPSADITETEACQKCQDVTDKILNRQGEEIERLKSIINVLNRPSAEAVQRWIPCSERLPKRDELVLVTYKTTDRIHLCRYIDDGSENPWWSYIDDCCAWNNVVLAWMPLPKPYREDGE